jgi:hypothetical protein
MINGASTSPEIPCAARPQARSRSALVAATETLGFSLLIQNTSRSIASAVCSRAAARTSSSSFGLPCGLPVFPFRNGRPRGRPFALYFPAICCFIVVIANFRPDCTSNPRLVERGRDDPANGRFRAEPPPGVRRTGHADPDGNRLGLGLLLRESQCLAGISTIRESPFLRASHPRHRTRDPRSGTRFVGSIRCARVGSPRAAATRSRP